MKEVERRSEILEGRNRDGEALLQAYGSKGEVHLKKLSKRRRIETAYHEAGHATIGRVLTLVCGEASIKPDYKLNRAGYSVCYSPYACAAEWSMRGKVRGPKAVWHARIIHCMAGDVAVRELLGDGPLFNDWEEIVLMLEHCPKADWEDEDDIDERLRKMTRMLVRRHRARIERVAKALLAKTALSTEELDKLVGRSVNDVKVNEDGRLRLRREAMRKLLQQIELECKKNAA